MVADKRFESLSIFDDKVKLNDTQATAQSFFDPLASIFGNKVELSDRDKNGKSIGSSQYLSYTANFEHVETPAEFITRSGPIISIVSLTFVIIIATISPYLMKLGPFIRRLAPPTRYLFHKERLIAPKYDMIHGAPDQKIFPLEVDNAKRDIKNWIMEKVDIITVDASVIAGVLIF